MAARRLALIVISVGLLIAGAGIVLVLVFDTLLGFVAVAASVLGARSGERRWAYIAYLERRGGRDATPALLGAASWIPSFSGGSEGPYLGGTGDSLGAGGDGGGSEWHADPTTRAARRRPRPLRCVGATASRQTR